jgi:hypothetical protein
MIERVPGLDAKLEIHRFVNRELLSQGQVGRECPRAPNVPHRSRSIAQREIGRTLENRVIGKVVVHPIRSSIAPGYSHDIWTLRTIGGQRHTIGDREGQRPSIGDAPDAVRFPSPENRIRPTRHAPEEWPPMAKRQIIAVAELNHVRNVERRQTTLQPRLIRILQVSKLPSQVTLVSALEESSIDFDHV